MPEPRSSSPAAASVLPLSGIRVLDLSRIVAGPLCAQYLADLGADVIKVERAGVGDDARMYSFPAMWAGVSAMYLSFNRGKRSIALDLSKAGDLATAESLVASADVLVENFRPGVMSRLGLGAEELLQRYPRLVYCSISGFGNEGPLAQSGANDTVAQASCGLMSLNCAEGGRPDKVVPAAVDMFTGVNAALAIVAGLRQRDLTGTGTHITTSLFESGISMLSYLVTSQFAPKADEDLSASLNVPNQSFKASDGWLVIACSNNAMWHRLCVAIGQKDMADDPRFATNLDRTHNRAELVAVLDSLLGERTRAEWAVVLDSAKVSNSAVLTLPEVLAHEQTASLDIAPALANERIEDFRMLRAPFRFDNRIMMSSRPPPALDEHRAEILTALK